MAYDRSRPAARRAIILLSDGEDNLSRVSREEAMEMAQPRRSHHLHHLHQHQRHETERRQSNRSIADATGGRAFFPFQIQEMTDAFSQIQEELRSQYAVAYKPADFQFNGKYHKIDILADNKKYKVRARRGAFLRAYAVNDTFSPRTGEHAEIQKSPCLGTLQVIACM